MLGLKEENKMKSKIYVAYSNKFFKIGETSTSISQRLAVIKHNTGEKLSLLSVIEFECDDSIAKPLRLAIESQIRLDLVIQGYEHKGNDHFIKKGHRAKFNKLCQESAVKVLAQYSEHIKQYSITNY